MASGAHEYALNLLSARAYTMRDLKRKLMQKEFERNEIEATVERLVSNGLLDDTRYAAEFARQRLVVRGSSVRRVEQELARKGIDRAIAKSAVATVAEEESVDTIRSMERIARKKLASLAGLEPQVQRRRLFGFLARHGYDIDDIKKVTSQVLP
jgi:regulatory protein